jgi:hypothetical protein
MPGVNTRYVSGGLKRVHWAFVIPIKVSAVDSDAVPKAAQNIPQAVANNAKKTILHNENIYSDYYFILDLD